MFLRRAVLLLLLAVLPCLGQSEKWKVDFLGSYYDQDGEHSPVTGGTGTEDLQTVGPVFVIAYQGASPWSFASTIGLDNISSASTDNIDMNVSSASSKDNRVFLNGSATRKFASQSLGFSVGFSKEYDYRSINGGLFWNRDFNQKNTNFAIGLNHYQDEIELYNIDGIVEGSDDRETTDLTLSLTQVLTPRAVAVFEFYVSDQSGFLSTPFHEVHFTDGSIAAERLPDTRQRMAFKAALNYAFSNNVILRTYARHYDDDWGIDAQSIELEPHFRMPFGQDTWLYPILRFHTQEGSDYWGETGTLNPQQTYATADWDIGTFDSQKFGLGFRTKLNSRISEYLDFRVTRYTRDGDFSSFNFAFGLGWTW